MGFLPRNRRVVNTLRLVWVVLILWYEYLVFWASGRRCGWPEPVTSGLRETDGASPAHILIVADPQILDHRSYPDRPAFLTYFSRLVVDLNLRKNWRTALAKNPDAIVFLGDMMDGGRMDMSNSEYEEYYSRFKNIFRTEKDIPKWFIPGNHDTGLQSEKEFSPLARTRYVSHFGPLNNWFSMSNHTLILFDAPGFVQEDYERAGQGKTLTEWKPRRSGSFELLKKYREENNSNPAVLFTHIPLYRPDGKPCGPLRERGTIRPGIGFGYQNTLGKQSTAFLLNQITPVVVFSGDDHDYCEHIHQGVIPRPVREVSVKSLSMAMNVRKPAFQLLTLFPAQYWDDTHPTFADAPCLLPDQIGIYLEVYIPYFLLSVCIVMCAAAIRIRRTGRNTRDALQPKPLPVPVSITEKTQTSVVCFGHRRSLPLGLGRVLTRRGSDKPTKRGFLGSVLHDVYDIAVFPIGIFITITVLVSL